MARLSHCLATADENTRSSSVDHTLIHQLLQEPRPLSELRLIDARDPLVHLRRLDAERRSYVEQTA